MIGVIANVLKTRLAALDWIERFGGLVTEAKRPRIVTGADGVQVVTGYDIFPVACDVNAANCWETGLYKYFMPDSTKSAIAFFTDLSGAQLERTEGAKERFLLMSFSVRFLLWGNTKRLGDDVTGGACNMSGRVAPYVIAQMWGKHNVSDAYASNTPEFDAYKNIEVLKIGQPVKSPSLFAPFTFAADGENRGLFLHPYDYFALNISGTFLLNKDCLPALYAGAFAPETDECVTNE